LTEPVGARADPYEVESEAIRDIEIWGTVLDGRPHPIP
jgi:hypothetical protein